MKIKYIDKKLGSKKLELISIANGIIDDYQGRGYDLTLRQLYYQLVARGHIENRDRVYKNLGVAIADGRNVGLIDWAALVDRTRARAARPTWTNPSEILEAVAAQYRVDKWRDQEYRVFCWVEKEALAGVVAQACGDHGIQVDHLSCRGYMSQSTIWREARNLRAVSSQAQRPVILHLGDLDPSGVDMTRDNIERLELYSGLVEGSDFIFKRIALNIEQVNEYNPPPNPAKFTDSRISNYVNKYGTSSWELDSLDPDVLVDLIRSTVREYQEAEAWAERVSTEAADRRDIRRVSENWDSLIN